MARGIEEKRSKGKRLVYVPEELIDNALSIARGRGETVSKFVEEAVQLAIQVCNVGLSLEKAAEALKVLQTHRVLGGAFVPQGVLGFMIENVYKSNREELIRRWQEDGRLYGQYLKERFTDPVSALKCFLEITRWDLNEVFAHKEGGDVRLRCVSTALSLEATELLYSFLEGILKGLGCAIKSSEYLKGMIIVSFKL